MSNKIKLSMDSMEYVDNIENELFRKVKMKAFASGENAHTLPIDEEVLKRGALTVYNKPILWKYNVFTDDANTHDEDETPCGFVPEMIDNKVNNVLFEREPDGRLFMVVNALIWTKYCGRLLEIFARDGNKKNVSIEISIHANDDENKANSNDTFNVLDFVITGITILGEWFEPACKGSYAELLKFSIEEFNSDKKKYMNITSFDKDTIKIDNSKESAINGIWSNPRRELFTPIINAKNKDTLLKEAYMISGELMSECKYPHHKVQDGKLLIHIRGLEAAFQRASQQGIVSGEIKAHFLRHYNELGLSKENFADFALDLNNGKSFSSKELDNIKNKERLGTYKVEKDKLEEERIAKEKQMEAERIAKEKQMELEKMAKEEECAKMVKKIEELEENNKAYMAKIDKMADYEDLKKFKSETEQKMAKDKEMTEMAKVISEVEKRGIKMTDDDKETYIKKFSTFNSIDAWGNFVKAQAFERMEISDGVIKFANVDTFNKKSNNNDVTMDNVWDILSK